MDFFSAAAVKAVGAVQQPGLPRIGLQCQGCSPSPRAAECSSPLGEIPAEAAGLHAFLFASCGFLTWWGSIFFVFWGYLLHGQVSVSESSDWC